MFKYRSKCRWNMLLYIDGEVIEIRPSELFESKSLVESRYLEILDHQEPEEKSKKK
jgi:superfamily II DNA or RNA helicase